MVVLRYLPSSQAFENIPTASYRMWIVVSKDRNSGASLGGLALKDALDRKEVKWNFCKLNNITCATLILVQLA